MKLGAFWVCMVRGHRLSEPYDMEASVREVSEAPVLMRGWYCVYCHLQFAAVTRVQPQLAYDVIMPRMAEPKRRGGLRTWLRSCWSETRWRIEDWRR